MRKPQGGRRARRRAGPKFHVASVVLASVLVAVIASEVMLRTAFDPLRVLDGDVMWEYRWRKAHASRGTFTDTNDVYGFDVHDAMLGWKPRPNYRTDTVRTNAMGIRAEREYAFERQAGISRIVLVGDSFVWGEGVPNEETFPSHLSRSLSDVEVINLGVHGYGTDQQLLRLRELGLRFAPDVVILGFYEENLWRNVLSFRDYAKPRFRLGQEELVLDNQPVPPPEAILADDQRLPRSFLLVLVRRFVRRARWQLGIGTERSEEWRITRAILELTKREVEAHGARFLLLYVPTPDIDEPGNAEALLQAWAEQSETAFVNLRERFVKLTDSERTQLYRGHWTPFGNRKVADIVAGFTSENQLLSGTPADMD
jgi:hypothetical protein